MRRPKNIPPSLWKKWVKDYKYHTRYCNDDEGCDLCPLDDMDCRSSKQKFLLKMAKDFWEEQKRKIRLSISYINYIKNLKLQKQID